MLGRLFVYGSLRPGGRAFEWLVGGSDVRAVTPAVLEDHALYGRGLPYPFVRAEPGATVVGEVIQLEAGRETSTLARLDRYEGDEYRRVVCSVIPVDGDPVDAWVYQAVETVVLRPGNRIESGDWSNP